MVCQNIHMKKGYLLLMFGLLLAILSGSRILWVNAFQDLSHIHIEKGQLDLRDWSADDGEVLLLDGEWEFYPSHWLVDSDAVQSSRNEETLKFVQVPGRWNEDFQYEKSTPYGFGSYRLQLYVNPEDKENYSLYVSSVRSSSEVYVNGRFLAGSGQVGKTEDEYIAKNLPYSATFTADDKGVIEIAIQAANFKDIRRSGIIRSIKFGSEAAIFKEKNLSLSMQVLASVIFLMHSIYALVLFFLGNREKRLLYFSLLVFCVTLMNLISNDEKLFHLLFNIGYEWDFRLANVLIPIACYALLQCIDHRNLPYWRRVSPVYSIVTIMIAAITLFLSPGQIIMLFPVYYLLAGIAIVITIMTIIKKLFSDITGNILLLFSFIAISHHFIWIIYWREAGISVVHYPFDLIISVVCFASIWFKDYFSMHNETEKLAAKLQKMNEHKDQFLANTSHEFKNPLHGIINMSQSVLAREKQVLQKKSVDELELVLTVGRRMTLLLNDLLDVASLREGNPRLQEKVISIQSVVTGVLDMLQFMAEIKPVKIVNQVPDDFPYVIADENRVIQIVYNLLHNAVKFTDEGKIQIQAKVKNERAIIIISDTGIGMDEDLLQRLFLPYEQASDETIIEAGFGLGLSISKQLIELHGGNLDVSSATGKGSKFTFSLRLAPADGYGEVGNTALMGVQHSVSETMPINQLTPSAIHFEKVDVLPARDQSVLMETQTERLPILIVDDDPVNLQVLQSILPVEQYDITTVSSGKEALEKLDEKEWDLVISDIMMPQMSGYELTKLIRNRFTLTELPILLLTARSEPKDIQTGFLAGANDYVTKPVEMLELRSRVRALTTVKKVVQEQLQLEAAWLQAQIQPHFLFNTLNSIIALSEIDLDEMGNLLNDLSEFLRNKFQFQHMDELIPIEDELNIVRSYVNIEQVRFGDRLEVVWETGVYKDVKIPFLTIQPLVENAIRHGIMKRMSGGKIVIKISVHKGYAEISVADDGIGMEEAQLRSVLERKIERATGVGLMNTNQRLKRHFGTGLQIKSTPHKGTVVSFVVSV